MVKQINSRVTAEAHRATAASSRARARARSHRNGVATPRKASDRASQLAPLPIFREVRTQDELRQTLPLRYVVYARTDGARHSRSLDQAAR